MCVHPRTRGLVVRGGGGGHRISPPVGKAPRAPPGTPSHTQGPLGSGPVPIPVLSPTPPAGPTALRSSSARAELPLRLCRSPARTWPSLPGKALPGLGLTPPEASPEAGNSVSLCSRRPQLCPLHGVPTSASPLVPPVSASCLFRSFIQQTLMTLAQSGPSQARGRAELPWHCVVCALESLCHTVREWPGWPGQGGAQGGGLAWPGQGEAPVAREWAEL